MLVDRPGQCAPRPPGGPRLMRTLEPTPRALSRVTGLLGAPTGGDELRIAADDTVTAIGWTPVPISTDRPAGIRGRDRRSRRPQRPQRPRRRTGARLADAEPPVLADVLRVQEAAAAPTGCRPPAPYSRAPG
jgi:hypothetical protein